MHMLLGRLGASLLGHMSAARAGNDVVWSGDVIIRAGQEF